MRWAGVDLPLWLLYFKPYLLVNSRKNKHLAVQAIPKLFALLDANGDGIVSSDEIKSAMTEYDEESDDIDPWTAFAAGEMSLIGLFFLMMNGGGGHGLMFSLCF